MMWKRSLYNPRPTLADLYAEDNTLFSNLSLPTGLELSTLRDLMLTEYGQCETIFTDAATLKSYLVAWSAKWLPSWTRMYEALSAEYDPLANYDRTEHETIGIETSGGDKVTGKSTDSGSEVATHSRQGYNSADFVGTDKDVITPGRVTDTSSETTLGSKHDTTRDATISGNIGVTTSQAMLEAELRLRTVYSIYGIIAGMFRSDIVVGVW